MEPHRIQGAFEYRSRHDIAAATKKGPMPMPPHPPDPGTPVFWVTWRDDAQYLINDSGETLPSVVVDTAGFETTESGMLTKQGDDLRYENVQPGEAVKIDFFDCMEDGVVQVLARVDSPTWGAFQMGLVRKGSEMSGEAVVLWGTGEVGRRVNICWEKERST